MLKAKSSRSHVILLGAGASRATCPNGEKNGKKLPIMNDLVPILELDNLLKKTEFCDEKNFEVMYEKLKKSSKYSKIANEVENRVFEYFSSLELPEEPTVYDYLIMSLRKKDLIATFNWDPLLIQAYERNMKKLGGTDHLPAMVFLHGNVSLGYCQNCETNGKKGHFCRCSQKFEPSPLLFPVGQKNYKDDPMINGHWKTLENHLRTAYCFTIFGYGAPQSDVEAKKIILEHHTNNQSRQFNEMEIIDIRDKEDVQEAWGEFTFSHHYSISNNIQNSLTFEFPRRSCEAVWEATMQCQFLDPKPAPKFKTINGLHQWLNPLMKEEKEN